MLSDLSSSKPALSSLPLQILTHFNWHYGIFFFLINLCIFTYKSIKFYYPNTALGVDFTTVFLYAIIESVRLLLVSKGNKTVQIAPLIVAFVLGLPLLVLHVYYLELQSYVLRIDTVINAISLFFLGSEMIISIFVVLSFVLSQNK